MSWRIVIDFDPHTEKPVGKVRDFGEALRGMCRDDTDGWASASLDEVDGATDRLHAAVRPARRVRRVVKLAEGLFEGHFLAERARVSVLRVGTEGAAILPFVWNNAGPAALRHA
jgi:hypothetical protein